ncbi:MAG: phosphatidylserine decarboxylase [Elusimicrobiota bacterium]
MKIPIAGDGFVLIKIFVIFAIASYILTRLHWFFYVVAAVFLFLTIFLLIFFRDPDRNIIQDEKLILSPADGTVLNIVKTGGLQTVEIFMSPLNVHVQRAPVDGTVSLVKYKKGAFLPAYVPKASDLNEQNVITIKNNVLALDVKQIAGVMVRRIVSYVKEGDTVVQGQRIGMIKFGSQVDITFPENVDIKVKVKEKAKAGITIIGEIK